MPDKDYIHSKINKYYRDLADAYRSSAYQEKFPEAMNVGMKKCAVDHREDVSRLASKIERKLRLVVEALPLERQNINWSTVHREIEKIVQRDKAPKRVKGIISECAEKLITRIEQINDIQEIGINIAREFLEKHFEADFKEPFKQEYSSKEFVDRVEEMVSEKEKDNLSKYYARQLITKVNAKQIRKNRLNENLSWI